MPVDDVADVRVERVARPRRIVRVGAAEVDDLGNRHTGPQYSSRD